MVSREVKEKMRWSGLYCWYWALRHEPKRVWLWWTMCRIPLSQCARTTCENVRGFEYTYAQDMPKQPLRLWTPRKERKLRKIFK